MKIKNSVTAKLVMATSLGIFVILLLTAWYIVSKISNNTSKQLDNDIYNAIQFNAAGIERYLESHAKNGEVIFRNTALIDWFNNRKQRGATLNTADFNRVKKVLLREMETDKDIASIFYGSAFTGEYFDQGGITSLTDYNVLERPWWNDVKNAKSWRVSSITFEPQIDAFYVALNFPIYNFDNEFIGVGGTDIYLKAIDKIISTIKYQDQGLAFLIDSNSDMIAFPDEKLAHIDLENRKTTNIKLHQLDNNKKNDGFAMLENQIKNTSQGIQQVTWRNNLYYVQYKEIVVSKLNLRWTLAIMVPQTFVDKPVNAAITSSILISIGILIITFIIMVGVTSRLLQPLLIVKQALVEISDGEGDLARRIPIRSEDEIGKLSEAFNNFAEKIQVIVSKVKSTSTELNHTTTQVAQISENTADKIASSQRETHKATDTVVQMAETAHVIKDQILIAQQAAKTASDTSKKSQLVLANSMEGLNQLNTNFDDAVHTIEDLRISSQSIGEVMDVIRNIADQTNLLALNAAIESARAGEHGRGFSVVADEVRQLAKRTQESTSSIQTNINDLQSKAHAAEAQMLQTREQVNQYMNDNQLVHSQLTEITTVVDKNSKNMQGIVDITQEQDHVSQSIRNVMQQIDALGDETNSEALKLMGISNHLADKTDRLEELVARFKV